MQVIDSHQHFWKYNSERHSWISEEMAAIQKDFLPDNLENVLLKNKVYGCVTVQANQNDEETNWMLSLAEEHSFIKGIVGWVDLQAPNIIERLQYFSSFPKLKGFRHILQDEEPSFLQQPSFVRGISYLKNFNFTYDILIYPKHLKAALELVKKFPEQKFVINHLGKPAIAQGHYCEWEKDITSFSEFENVYCKISGMVTEADWNTWTSENLRPYLDTVIKTFNTKRIMFGSDWPVCLLAASYEKWLQTVQQYFSSFSKNEQEDFFSGNAKQFYNL